MKVVYIAHPVGGDVKHVDTSNRRIREVLRNPELF